MQKTFHSYYYCGFTYTYEDDAFHFKLKLPNRIAIFQRHNAVPKNKMGLAHHLIRIKLYKLKEQRVIIVNELKFL